MKVEMLLSQPKVIYSAKHGNRHMSNNFKHGVIAENTLITVLFFQTKGIVNIILMLRSNIWAAQNLLHSFKIPVYVKKI